MKIGIGTYSFGGMASYLGLGPTLLEKLRTIKELGFNSVELLPVDLENDPEDIKSWLAETGLQVTSVHAEPNEEMVRKLAAVGGKAVIWASTPFCNKAEALEVAEQLEKMAEAAEPYGIKVGYHNHSQEFYFDEGKCLLEHLLDNTKKAFVQLDCGWAMNGGMYPPYFIRRYRDRIISIHVKENSKVVGPGERPASRHGEQPMKASAFANVKELPIEERQKILDGMTEKMSANKEKFAVQCKMGAPQSNLDWREIKKALDEQKHEAFWVVEREGFYDEHDKCIAEDCAFIRAMEN